MADRNITHLDPAFQPVAQKIIDSAKMRGIDARIIETWRGPVGQNMARRAGKSKAGFGASPHNCVDSQGHPAARAFDFGIFNADGSYCGDGRDTRYTHVGMLSEAFGCVWAGSWTQKKDGCDPDFDHIQMANWRAVPMA